MQDFFVKFKELKQFFDVILSLILLNEYLNYFWATFKATKNPVRFYVLEEMATRWLSSNENKYTRET